MELDKCNTDNIRTDCMVCFIQVLTDMVSAVVALVFSIVVLAKSADVVKLVSGVNDGFGKDYSRVMFNFCIKLEEFRTGRDVYERCQSVAIWLRTGVNGPTILMTDSCYFRIVTFSLD